MIRIFLGKPGAGKSYGALRDILDEAVNGRRVLVTNLALDPGALSEYIQKRHPGADWDPVTRYVRLSAEQVTYFWRHRLGVSLPPFSKEREDNVPEGLKGCLYVIDEAHIYFDARAWALTGLELSFYNSQHRKFDDQVVFVTQFLDLLDRRVRGFCQEFVYFQNHGLQRFLTCFRLPAYFTAKTYSKPYTGATGDNCEHAARFTLDKELAACYDTSAGVGISGRGKPENNPVRGVNFFWIGIPLGLLVTLFYFTPDLFTALMSSLFNRVQTPVVGRADLGVKGSELVSGPTPKGRADERPQEKINTVAPAPVFMTAHSLKGGRVYVWLSDGRILNRNHVHRLTEDRVYLKDGSFYDRGSVSRATAQRSLAP